MSIIELFEGTQQANQAANYIRGSISGASEAGKRILNHASSQKSVIGFRPPSNMRSNPVYSRLQSVDDEQYRPGSRASTTFRGEHRSKRSNEFCFKSKTEETVDNLRN